MLVIDSCEILCLSTEIQKANIKNYKKSVVIKNFKIFIFKQLNHFCFYTSIDRIKLMLKKRLEKMRKIIYFFAILIIVTSNPIRAQLPIIKSDADSLIQLGKDYVYNVEFNKASQCFKEVIKKYPDHPAGYFLDAMIEWWKITLYRRTEKYDNLFLKKLKK